MANLSRKNGVYLARFRFAGKEYKKSLRTCNSQDARAAMHAVQRALHGLLTGMLQVPTGVDPGDFVISGGTLRHAARKRKAVPSVGQLIEDYIGHQSHIAPSYRETQACNGSA